MKLVLVGFTQEIDFIDPNASPGGFLVFEEEETKERFTLPATLDQAAQLANLASSVFGDDREDDQDEQEEQEPENHQEERRAAPPPKPAPAQHAIPSVRKRLTPLNDGKVPPL